MSNTVLAAGADDPAKILRDVERGYYLAAHRIPSIAESRENFRISARRVYEIVNGVATHIGPSDPNCSSASDEVAVEPSADADSVVVVVLIPPATERVSATMYTAI